MIEAYAFLAVFAAQILVLSVLYPAWFIRYCEVRMASYDAGRLAQMYPGVDFKDPKEWRFLVRYRALNTAIAVLGLLLLGGFFLYTRRSDWDDGGVTALVSAYFMLQMIVPWGFVIFYAVRFNKKYKRTVVDIKRKAVLERRRLFDFVSPVAVLLSAMGYVLYVAYVIYIAQHPFRGFAGIPVNLAAVTMIYASQAFVVYKLLYGRNRNPLDTHADRMHMLGFTVKCCVYTSIVSVVFMSTGFTLKLLDLERWAPFALSVNFLIVVLLISMNLLSPPRRQDAAGLDPSPIS